MCSSRWEMPVTPELSFREPTLYQTMNETTGAPRTSWISTLRPLSRRVSKTGLSGPNAARVAAASDWLMDVGVSFRPLERGHAFDVGRVREHVHRLDPLSAKRDSQRRPRSRPSVAGLHEM